MSKINPTVTLPDYTNDSRTEFIEVKKFFQNSAIYSENNRSNHIDTKCSMQESIEEFGAFIMPEADRCKIKESSTNEILDNDSNEYGGFAIEEFQVAHSIANNLQNSNNRKNEFRDSERAMFEMENETGYFHIIIGFKENITLKNAEFDTKILSKIITDNLLCMESIKPIKVAKSALEEESKVHMHIILATYNIDSLDTDINSFKSGVAKETKSVYKQLKSLKSIYAYLQIIPIENIYQKINAINYVAKKKNQLI